MSPDPEEPAAAEEDRQVIDLVTDELALARAQIDAGLAPLAEGTLVRRLARLEADGAAVSDEADAVRALLAEALWRQQRPVAARGAVEAIRPSSPQRRLPIVQVVEAEGLAAAGELDRAAGVMERVVDAIGADQAWSLRAGAPSRLPWPLPADLRPEPARAPRPPWSPAQRPVAATLEPAQPPEAGATPTGDTERLVAARGRLEEARVAYVAGDLERGDAEMSIALRLDPALAADGVTIMEPTLGGQPAPDRLLLYGDLLRAAGRELEANQAYDRAADRRS
ncbi:MAG TPA: hypothetical protein VHQ42_01885 [Candidatus Limnocylindria bacterium]|nr:hypothetical protein [Candidatus Limnocylindria bacterium]